MPRKPRTFVAGGIYHVFNRGNNQKPIFEEPADFRCFLSLLKKGLTRAVIEIYHYCVMPNHCHLLLKSGGVDDLPRFMHWVQLGYARYYKRKNSTTGHIFEERYRSPQIAEDSYYLQCGRYIERNPVKAGITERAEEYPFSSAAYYIKGIPDPLITENMHYQEMGKSPAERRRNYSRFIGMAEPYAELISEQLLKY